MIFDLTFLHQLSMVSMSSKQMGTTRLQWWLSNLFEWWRMWWAVWGMCLCTWIHWHKLRSRYYICSSHRYRKGIPELLYRPVQWCRQPWSSNWRVFRFLPTSHTKTNANKMHPRSFRSLRRFTWMYLQAQTAEHTHVPDESWLFWYPNWSPKPE